MKLISKQDLFNLRTLQHEITNNTIKAVYNQDTNLVDIQVINKNGITNRISVRIEDLAYYKIIG